MDALLLELPTAGSANCRKDDILYGFSYNYISQVCIAGLKAATNDKHSSLAALGYCQLRCVVQQCLLLASNLPTMTVHEG